MAVVDAHEGLDTPHPLVREVSGDEPGGLRVEPTVGVDDGDDDLVGIPARERALAQDHLVEVSPRRVQRGGLAATGVGGIASQHRQRSVGEVATQRVEQFGRPVGRPVVDDQHDAVCGLQCVQPTDGVGDRDLFVERGDHHHPQQLRGGDVVGMGEVAQRRP